MRILHTSDWHLGRTFGEHRMLHHQELVLDWMVGLVRSEGVELVVVSGDLFDRSVPPAEALQLLWESFRRFTDAGARVVAISGNHDSAERLGVTDGITDLAGIHLRAGYGRAAEVIPVPLPSGELSVVSVPYLDPRMCPVEHPARSAGTPTHETVLADVAGRARAGLPSGTASLVLAHAFVTGAEPSPSERDLTVGQSGMVSASVFSGFDYVALGHLHRAQVVAGDPTIRYSGAPLAYSFGETASKEVTLVDIAGPGEVRTQSVTIDVGPAVRTHRGTLEGLLAGEADHGNWVRAELTDAVRPVDAARRLRERFGMLVEVDWTARPTAAAAGPRADEARALPPLELACRFFQEVVGEAPGDAERDVLIEAFGGPPADDEVAA